MASLALSADLPPIAARLRGVASSPVREILALTARPGVISFAGGLPAPELFDAPGLREAFAAALADGDAGRSLQYSTTEGDPELRAAIAQRLTARGLPTGRRRGAGDQRLAAGADAGRRRADRARRPRAGRGAVLPRGAAGVRAGRRASSIPVACDDDGLDPDAVAAAAGEHGARLLYTIPTFHNPTGRTLPLERRRALAAVAERHGLWLLEDDPYGELRYRGEPLPSLATLPGPRTARWRSRRSPRSPRPACGSAGCARRRRCARRSWWPSRRPTCTRRRSTRRPRAHWLATVDLDAHIASLRAEYGRRRDALLDGLRGRPAARARPTTAPTAACSSGRGCPTAGTRSALLRRALERDVAFVPGYPFFAGEPDRATLRFSFTTHPPAEIAEGLARLRPCLALGWAP